MTDDEDKRWCVRCKRLDTQPAGEECKNSDWHAAPAPKQEVSEGTEDWV